MQKAGFIIVALLGSPLACGAEPGTTSANFLQLGVNPRAIAMGEAQVAACEDVYAAYWNPAGLARIQTPEAGLVHSELWEGIHSEYAAYAHPVAGFGTVAASLTHLHMDAFGAYDAVGQPRGEVDASGTALGLSYARSLWMNRRMGSELALGATGKWIQEQLDTSVARAYTLDAGLLYVPGRLYGDYFEGFKAGLAVRHAGTRLTFDQEAFSLPRSLAAGLSWTGLWLGEMVTFALDAEKAKDHRPTLGAGVELSTLRLVLLRAGYTSKGDLGTGLRLGAGLRFRTLQLDYAYASAGTMGPLHRIGFTLRFGIAPADPVLLGQTAYTRGLLAFRRGQYTEALVHFNKALETDPTHPDALEKMKESYEKLKPTAAQ